MKAAAINAYLHMQTKARTSDIWKVAYNPKNQITC